MAKRDDKDYGMKCAEWDGEGSLADFAYHTLLEQIRAGELTAGTRLREMDLASDLGISRTPVREAIKRLESEGLLTSAQNRGLVVSSLDYQAVMELYQMRSVLEGTAAGLAAKHASDAELAALGDILTAEREMRSDSRGRAKQNRRFHSAIYYAAHNRYLLKSLSSLREALVLLGPTTYSVKGRQDSALEEHQRIFDAIKSKDATKAETAAREHIYMALRIRLLIFNES